MRQTQAPDFLDRVGEALVRALMLGLLVITGILFLPIALALIACWLIYATLKHRPHESKPEYAIVE